MASAVLAYSKFSRITEETPTAQFILCRVYALHAFQKKAKVGIKTPKPDIDLIRERYKRAEEQHEQWTQQVKARETS
jgi:hypothetical protein